METESMPPPDRERYLSPAAVAGRLLTRVESVQRWIQEGRLQAVTVATGQVRIPESSLLAFEHQAYRRENFPGVHHGLHSWPEEHPEGANLPVPVEDAHTGEALAARWPFPHS